MIIGFVIWSIAAVCFLGIGISCLKSKEAVGFFTFVKPSVIENVEQYNHAVSKLWFITAFVFEILGIPFLFAEQNSPVFILMVPEIVILVIGMIIAYTKIEMKYKKK